MAVGAPTGAAAPRRLAFFTDFCRSLHAEPAATLRRDSGGGLTQCFRGAAPLSLVSLSERRAGVQAQRREVRVLYYEEQRPGVCRRRTGSGGGSGW